MKKFLLLFLFLSNLTIFAQEIESYSSSTPSDLKGIWKGDDRYIFLGEENKIAVILKTFYGWYYDTAAISENMEEIKNEKRDHNDSSSKEPQYPRIEYKNLLENSPVWEVTIHHSKKDKTVIPLCVVDNKIYLKFLLRKSILEEDDQSEVFPPDEITEENENVDNIFGFWQGINSKDTIRISTQKDQENLACYYITSNSIYNLRFWQTDMEFEPYSTATFNDSDSIFRINKHLESAGKIYTCATGKRGRIRNVNRFSKFPEDFKVDSTKTIITIGKPAFEKEKPDDVPELLKIIKEANSRHHMMKPPYSFEKHQVDWHWELIYQVEKNNPWIQKIRTYEDYQRYMQYKTD